MTFRHVSVLLPETIEGLNIRPDGIYADGTLGGGGHASEVAARLTEGGRLIGIDQDADAIAAAGERLKPFGDRVTIVRDNYVNMKHVLADLGIEAVDGICLDLGVSSYQLDTAERGFSYMEDAPLDMRMDRRADRTAADLVRRHVLLDGPAEIIRRAARYIADRLLNVHRLHVIDDIVECSVAAAYKEHVEITGAFLQDIPACQPPGRNDRIYGRLASVHRKRLNDAGQVSGERADTGNDISEYEHFFSADNSHFFSFP